MQLSKQLFYQTKSKATEYLINPPTKQSEKGTIFKQRLPVNNCYQLHLPGLLYPAEAKNILHLSRKTYMYSPVDGQDNISSPVFLIMNTFTFLVFIAARVY